MATTFLQPAQPVVLGTGSAVIYTPPATPTTQILRNGRVRLTNTTAGAVTATLYAAPSATASAASNAFLSAYSIPANSYLDVDVPVLLAGDTMRGLASAASSITVHWLDGFLYS